MRLYKAVEHFGSKAALAAILGLTRSSVSQWGELVPPLRAAQLQAITDGALQFDPREYQHWNRPQKRQKRKAR